MRTDWGLRNPNTLMKISRQCISAAFSLPSSATSYVQPPASSTARTSVCLFLSRSRPNTLVDWRKLFSSRPLKSVSLAVDTCRADSVDRLETEKDLTVVSSWVRSLR